MRNLKRKPRLLWASVYTLLSQSNGAILDAREMLVQLQKNGYEIKILGATILGNEKGTPEFYDHAKNLQESNQQYALVEDGDLTHKLIKTEHTARAKMTSAEENLWFKQYTELLQEFKPDVVFFYASKMPFDLLIAYEAKIRGIKTAAFIAHQFKISKRWSHDIDLLITDSQATSKMYHDREGLSISTVGAFVDSQQIIAKHRDPKRILFVNAMWEKGSSIVAQLALTLEKRRPDIVFEVIESRGNWTDKLQKVSSMIDEKRNALDNVIVLPQTSDMCSVYANARLLLAPSLWWESFPRVVAEALMNGIPVIASKSGGLPEMVADGGVIFDFPSRFFQKPYFGILKADILGNLIKTIERFYDDEVFYQGIVEKSLKQAKMHSVEVNTERLLAAFNPLIDECAGDHCTIF